MGLLLGASVLTVVQFVEWAGYSIYKIHKFVQLKRRAIVVHVLAAWRRNNPVGTPWNNKYSTVKSKLATQICAGNENNFRDCKQVYFGTSSTVTGEASSIYSSSSPSPPPSFSKNSFFLAATRALRSSSVNFLAFQRLTVTWDGSLSDFWCSGSARMASWAFL